MVNFIHPFLLFLPFNSNLSTLIRDNHVAIMFGCQALKTKTKALVTYKTEEINYNIYFVNVLCFILHVNTSRIF